MRWKLRQLFLAVFPVRTLRNVRNFRIETSCFEGNLNRSWVGWYLTSNREVLSLGKQFQCRRMLCWIFHRESLLWFLCSLFYLISAKCGNIFRISDFFDKAFLSTTPVQSNLCKDKHVNGICSRSKAADVFDCGDVQVMAVMKLLVLV